MSGHQKRVEVTLLTPPEKPRAVASPVIYLGFSLILGIALGRLIPLIEFWLVAAALSLLITLAWSWRARRRAVRLWSCITLIALGAAWLIVSHGYISRDDIANDLTAAGQLVRLEGTLDSPLHTTAPDHGPFAKFSFRTPGSRASLAVSAIFKAPRWQPADGQILLSFHRVQHDLRPGDRVRLWGWLSPIRGPSNPGEFDYRAYLWQTRRIAARLTLDGGSQVQILSRASASPIHWRSFRSAVHQRAQAALDAGLPRASPVADMLHALLLGDRAGGGAIVQQAFVHVGLAHLMAISGAHLGVFLAMFWLIARLLTARPIRAVLIVLIALAAYLLAIPAQVPVIRAAIMAGMFCLGYMTGRRTRAIDLLMLAAIILLLWRPAYLFNPGFQLSFAIVAALLLFVDPWSRRLAQPFARLIDHAGWRAVLTRGAVKYGALTFVAFVAALPLVAYHFHQIYPWSGVLSILVLPLFVVVLTLGYIKIIIGLLWPPLGGWLAYPILHAGGGLLAFIQWSHHLPGISLSVSPSLSPLWLFAAAALAVSLLSGQFKKRPLPLTGALVLMISWTWMADQPRALERLTHQPQPAMEVSMLAVGNGSCYVIQSGGCTLMFDCGSDSYLDVGSKTVVPALASLHIHHIDMLILSHADIDHYCGSLDVADAIPVARVFMTPQMFDKAQRQPHAAIGCLLAGLRQRHLPISLIHRGWHASLGSARLSLLWPPPDFQAPHDNDMCAVLAVTAGHRRLLLNGDIEQIAMQGLFAYHTNLHADLTDLPHHGSFVEDSPRWFKAVAPALVLQSTGFARLVHDKWAPILTGTGVDRYITATQGMVRLKVMSQGSVWVKPFLHPRSNQPPHWRQVLPPRSAASPRSPASSPAAPVSSAR